MLRSDFLCNHFTAGSRRSTISQRMKTPLVSTKAIAHEKSMWQALKRLSYWFFIDSDQSIYQWMQKERQKHWERGCGCTATVMDYWKGNVQNVLCRVCALHIKDSAQENGSCQHLQTYSKKMQPYCIKNKILEREKKKKNSLHSHLNITERWRNTCARTHNTYWYIHTSVSLSSHSQCVIRSIKKRQLQPPAVPSGLFLRQRPAMERHALLDYSFAGCNSAHCSFPHCLMYAEFPDARAASVRLRHTSSQELK